jgi:hypothetical protein
MAGNISYYFTLFKKFQVLNHVPEQTVHGAPSSPTGNFQLNDPSSVFGGSATFPSLLGAINDIPNGVVNPHGGAINDVAAVNPGPLTPGVSLFVCSAANDTGVRPPSPGPFQFPQTTGRHR